MPVGYRGVIDARIGYLHAHPDVDPEQHSAAVADLFLSGIAQEPSAVSGQRPPIGEAARWFDRWERVTCRFAADGRVARTGRLVSSAALILFLAFIVVRGVLAPALVAALGPPTGGHPVDAPTGPDQPAEQRPPG